MSDGVKKLADAIVGTVKGSFFYATTWDMFARPKAIRSQVWDFKDKLPDVMEVLKDESLRTTCLSFQEKCSKAENDETFDYMETDDLVEAFIDLITVVESSELIKKIELNEKDTPFITAKVITSLKEALAGLAKEMAEKKVACQ